MDGEVFNGRLRMVHCYGDWEKGQGGKGAAEEIGSIVRFNLKEEAVIKTVHSLSSSKHFHHTDNGITLIICITSVILHIISSLPTRFWACNFFYNLAPCLHPRRLALYLGCHIDK